MEIDQIFKEIFERIDRIEAQVGIRPKPRPTLDKPKAAPKKKTAAKKNDNGM